jgi:hypothetical protein
MTDQSSFGAALLDPETPPPPGLTDAEGRPAGRRFDVYRNNVAASLTDALATGFPVIAKLLGASSSGHGRRLPARPSARAIRACSSGAEVPGLSRPVRARGPPALPARHGAAGTGPAPVLPRRRRHAAAHRGPRPGRGAGAEAPPRARHADPASRFPVLTIWQKNTGRARPGSLAPRDVLITRPGFDPEPHALPRAATRSPVT